MVRLIRLIGQILLVLLCVLVAFAVVAWWARTGTPPPTPVLWAGIFVVSGSCALANRLDIVDFEGRWNRR